MPTGARWRGGTGNFSYVDNVEVQQWYHVGPKSATWPQHTLTAMWTGPPDDPKAMPEQWLADYLHDEFGDSGVIWESAACLRPDEGTDDPDYNPYGVFRAWDSYEHVRVKLYARSSMDRAKAAFMPHGQGGARRICVSPHASSVSKSA